MMLQNEEGGKGEISSFSALCTALSATIGTGNIVGVATAVCAGVLAPCSWMVVAAFLGMATKYSEGLLAVKYRTVAEDGHSLGILSTILNSAWAKILNGLAKIFAFFGVCVGLFGIGTFSQVNGISSAVHGFFDPNDAFTVKILPFLGEYSWSVVIASLILSFCRSCFDRRRQENCKRQPDHRSLHGSHLFCIRSDPDLPGNITKVPAAFATIVTAAFSSKAITGGAVGSMLIAMQKGVARAFSPNEAGLGSAPIAAVAAQTNSPVRQGLVSMTGTFIDTIIICTLTGLSIVP